MESEKNCDRKIEIYLILSLFSVIFVVFAGVLDSLESFLGNLPQYQSRVDSFVGKDMEELR